jgi:D-amino-acid dehydrogenase
MKSDVIVLGAGMVGISAALHLLKRGRSVVLLDRRGPAEETSYGNAGLIQREGVVPYMFPRDLSLLLTYARNNSTDASYHLSALPHIAPWMFRYWLASTPEGKAASARAMLPLVERCIVEHEEFMGEAGILGMLRRFQVQLPIQTNSFCYLLLFYKLDLHLLSNPIMLQLLLKQILISLLFVS